jgi:heme-degrading monooxygenase HmoA
MSVLVTLKIQGDTEQFRRLMAEQPERFSEIAPEAKAAGALHHRFGVGDGYVVVIDEWESAEAFQQFFGSSTKIPAIMRDAGAMSEPEITFAEAISSPDEF